ncbi:MAG TPA: hypothetical protein VGF27_10970 [Pseudoduganella sp.]
MSSLHYPIRVPSDLLESLGEFTGHCWSDSLSLEPFICEAIRNYLRPAAAAQAHAQPAAATGSGYQWKQVFLPEGTRLRASFGGHNYFAQVEGGEIKYGEHAMSPSRFANLQGSGNRNAWKAVWLCLPGSEEWLLADVCRSARQAAIARLIGEVAPARRSPRAREQTGEPKQSGKPKKTGEPEQIGVREQMGEREQSSERERRVAERRTPRGTANGRRALDQCQPGVRESALYAGGSRQSASGAPVVTSNKNQRCFSNKSERPCGAAVMAAFASTG